MDISEKKKVLRSKMIAERAHLLPAAKSKYDQWICDALWAIIRERKCKNVHCYLPMEGEINISPLIDKMLEQQICVITPKTLKHRKLEHLILNDLSDVEDGIFGTRHPANSKEFDGQYDLIIVPGLAFDLQNNRLGYGGGYYDNFLISHPSAFKIAIAYPFQVLEEVPTESHDIVLDEVLYNA